MAASRNPYDRRRDERERERGVLAGDMAGWTPNVGPRESPIAMGDLEALVSSAQGRAYQDAQRQAMQRERGACREAWDEGHGFGMADGRVGLLLAIDRQHGADARDVLERIRAALPRPEGVGKEQRLEQLESTLGLAESFLAALVAAHHNGFEDHPF